MSPRSPLPLVLALVAACGTSASPPIVEDASLPDSAAPAPEEAGPGDSGLADSGLEDAGPRDSGPPPFAFAYADVNHVLGTGQSLSIGSQGRPILSTTQPFANLMFQGGVRPADDALSRFAPLVEGPSQETHNSAFANLVTGLAEGEVFVGQRPPRNTHTLLVSIHGIGGTAYAGLKKGTAAYASGMAQVQAAKRITDGAGLSYVVRAVTNVHGESDHVAGNLRYKDDLVAWQRDYDTDVRAITGQAARVPMFQTQVSSWTKYGQATSPIPMAQLDAATESGGAIVMVGPKYQLSYVADGVHLTNEGYRHMGEYYGKVYRRVILEGRAWEPVRPKQIVLRDATILVDFYVPEPPLVLDTTLVTNPGNFGFSYTDDSANPPTIQSVALQGPTSVKITLSGAPTGGSRRLRYAFVGTPGALAGATTGPRGNLRDSDAAASRYGYKLFNWAVHFEAPL